jgi:hypothetical protein
MICSICAITCRHRSLTVFFGTLLIFSKEPGILLYSLLISPYLVHDALNRRLSLKSIYPYLTPLLLFILYYIFTRGNLWANEGTFTWDNNGYNCFGLNDKTIRTRLLEMFVLNFSWIFSITAITAILLATKKKPTGIMSVNIISLLLAFSGYAALNLLFIGPVVPRYIICSIFFMTMFFYFSFKVITTTRIPFLVVSCIVIVLNLAQTFKTIDPVSKYFFGTFSFGSNNILKIGFPGDYGGSRFVYNNEFTVINKLYNSFNKAINITGETNLIIGKDDWDNCFIGSYEDNNIYIDSTTLTRTHRSTGSFQPHLYQIGQPVESLPRTAYYIHTPWSEANWNSAQDNNLVYLQQYYAIDVSEEITYNGYSIKYYKLRKKQPATLT